ncbi:MAG: adenylate kinase [Spirochaetales bacterium]|nr:adenylate kinase [Spirochaetales bacterium]
MKLVFFGPPGAGKGTIAVKLAEKLGIPHISTGDLFRAAIKNQTDLGKKVKQILDSGALVPDELTVDLVRERLTAKDTNSGYILDGFPRTIPQAEALAGITELDAVINFEVSDEILIKRLSGRRICSSCGFIHHVEFQPPKHEGICDRCGGKLIQREDDSETSIRKRLSVYQNQTAPLLGYYEKTGLMIDIDGAPAPAEVLSSVTAALEHLK